MTTERATLTVSDAAALGELVNYAHKGVKVARLRDGRDVIYGMARSIGNDGGGFAGEHDDVRDAFMRVTTKSGFEAFWPISELLPEIKRGEFTNYDW